jgi:hypothetical protein
MSFPALLERLYVEKHTGPVLLHFAGGQPRSVEILKPSERIPLDCANRCDSLTDTRTLAEARSDDASAT